MKWKKKYAREVRIMRDSIDVRPTLNDLSKMQRQIFYLGRKLVKMRQGNPLILAHIWSARELLTKAANLIHEEENEPNEMEE